MTQNKKPVVIVAIVLVALIVLPLLLLLITRAGGSDTSIGGGSDATPINSGTSVADFNLRQLAEKAETLLEQELAEALRRGDVSLDFMAALKSDASEAEDAMGNGRFDRATEYYTRVIKAAESQLAALALADRARALNDSTYAELQRLEHLRRDVAALGPARRRLRFVGHDGAEARDHPRSVPPRGAVETYNTGLRALNTGEFQASINDFEMVGGILGDIEARAIQQTADLLETAGQALEAYKLDAARAAYQSVLDIDAANAAATEGLAMVTALEGIAEEVKVIRALEESGDLAGALAELERLAADNPKNPFIRKKRATLEARILERDFQGLVAASVEAEKTGDFNTAITSLEAALQLKSDPAQQSRLAELKETYKAARLEVLLTDGFDALTAARYEAARNIYKEAVALAPDSKEARNGLEKASSLYLANIRYRQNVAAAEKYLKEGRFPLAAKLFNEAMSSRPSKVAPGQRAEEARIRSTLEAQSNEVTVTIESDNRTYVSIIGVLPPNRFREEKLKLFPDVYKVRGTRSGYESVEFDLKVDATKPNPKITVECTERI